MRKRFSQHATCQLNDDAFFMVQKYLFFQKMIWCAKVSSHTNIVMLHYWCWGKHVWGSATLLLRVIYLFCKYAQFVYTLYKRALCIIKSDVLCKKQHCIWSRSTSCSNSHVGTKIVQPYTWAQVAAQPKHRLLKSQTMATESAFQCPFSFSLTFKLRINILNMYKCKLAQPLHVGPRP